MEEHGFGIHRRSFSWRKPKPDDEIPPLPRTMSLPPPPRGWVEVTVSAYNLKWFDLRNWLLEAFKNSNPQFNEKQTLYADFFYFWAPRYLTNKEKLAIDSLRVKTEKDEKRHNDRRARTPDHGTQMRDDREFED